jgi:hypothetical protein
MQWQYIQIILFNNLNHLAMAIPSGQMQWQTSLSVTGPHQLLIPFNQQPRQFPMAMEGGQMEKGVGSGWLTKAAKPTRGRK